MHIHRPPRLGHTQVIPAAWTGVCVLPQPSSGQAENRRACHVAWPGVREGGAGRLPQAGPLFYRTFTSLQGSNSNRFERLKATQVSKASGTTSGAPGLRVHAFRGGLSLRPCSRYLRPHPELRVGLSEGTGGHSFSPSSRQLWGDFVFLLSRESPPDLPRLP